MKRLFLAAALAAGLASPALAGQCPVDMGKIDSALAANPRITADQKAEVAKLRTEGEMLHKTGKHKESVETLAEAKEILGIQ